MIYVKLLPASVLHYGVVPLRTRASNLGEIASASTFSSQQNLIRDFQLQERANGSTAGIWTSLKLRRI
jgi:hypothetical protein